MGLFKNIVDAAKQAAVPNPMQQQYGQQYYPQQGYQPGYPGLPGVDPLAGALGGGMLADATGHVMSRLGAPTAM